MKRSICFIIIIGLMLSVFSGCGNNRSDKESSTDASGYEDGDNVQPDSTNENQGEKSDENKSEPSVIRADPRALEPDEIKDIVYVSDDRMNVLSLSVNTGVVVEDNKDVVFNSVNIKITGGTDSLKKYIQKLLSAENKDVFISEIMLEIRGNKNYSIDVKVVNPYSKVTSDKAVSQAKEYINDRFGGIDFAALADDLLERNEGMTFNSIRLTDLFNGVVQIDTAIDFPDYSAYTEYKSKFDDTIYRLSGETLVPVLPEGTEIGEDSSKYPQKAQFIYVTEEFKL